MYHLVVVHDFGDYTKGQMITAADEVDLIWNSPNHVHVVRIAAPSSDAPAQREVAPINPAH